MDQAARPAEALVYRQRLPTRLAHWLWAVCLFFLLLSGLQIFMARPDLYVGHQSGFQFDNSFLSVGATRNPDGTASGFTELFGHRFDTTGWLGLVDVDGRPQARTFPAWATIPSYRDLGTGRVVHFFFSWLLVAALLFWFLCSVLNGHIRRDLVPRGRDLRALPRDVWDHLRLRFHRRRHYNILQKLSYASVLFVAMPLMIASGLAMSPGVNALAPWLLDVLGGRQTARTIHFVVMLLLVLFFVVHVAMTVLAGPINEMRSIVTGWYKVTPGERDAEA